MLDTFKTRRKGSFVQKLWFPGKLVPIPGNFPIPENSKNPGNITSLISCSKVEFFFRGSLFLSIQKQESSALFSTYITEGKFYISIVWQSSWKKENSYLILFWFQWWHKNSSWLTSQMSYGILIWTTEISIKEELKKTTKKKFDIFLSIMNHVKIVL